MTKDFETVKNTTMNGSDVVENTKVTDELDWQALDAEAEELCRWAAARAGVIVVTPLLGTVALMANEVYLINKLANLYNKKLTESAVIGFAGALGGTVVGSMCATLIPIPFLQIPIAVGVTYGVGKAAMAWIKADMPADLTPYVEMFKEWSDKAKSEATVFADNPLKNCPLGDETKTFIADTGEKLSIKVDEMKEKVVDSLATYKESAMETADVLSEHTIISTTKASDKLNDMIENLTETALLLKEHAAVAVDNLKPNHDENSTCPMEKVKDVADFATEKAIVTTQALRTQAADKIEAVAEGIKEISDVLTERIAMGAESISNTQSEKISNFIESLGDLGFVIKERIAMSIPKNNEFCQELGELCQEHLAIKSSEFGKTLKSIGESICEAGHLAKEHALVAAINAKNKAKNTTTSQKLAIVGAIAIVICLVVVSSKLKSMAEKCRREKQPLSRKDLAQMTELIDNAKKIIAKAKELVNK